ncbi:hypothetical protein FW784_13590, partial [Lysobacter lacus]
MRPRLYRQPRRPRPRRRHLRHPLTRNPELRRGPVPRPSLQHRKRLPQLLRHLSSPRRRPPWLRRRRTRSTFRCVRRPRTSRSPQVTRPA